MSLQINGSNSLEQLAGELSRQLQRQGNHVFQPQYIVTQTQGMNNWLKIKIAGNVGIVANCKFLKPNDVVNEIYCKLGARNTSVLSPGVLRWVLFTLLSSKEFQNEFRRIANYYTNDDVKRMALAEKVADLFDQYQIYRPEMIRQWNADPLSLDLNNGWQKYLWVKAKEVLGESMPDKTVIGKSIVEALKEPAKQKKIQNQIPNIHVFGLSIITTYHVHIFYELAKVINVTFHLLNPAPAVYWFEDKSEKQLALWRQKSNLKLTDAHLQNSGNPLLTGWGRVLQDTFSMFFESEEFLNQYADIESPEPLTKTLLGKIQNDIFNNHNSESRNRLSVQNINDGSITINACYTTAREVEVLYNYLVHLVDQKSEQLSARDIVVMVSDIDAYAPYIKAVFNAAKYKFPFNIADESFTVSDNLFSALQSLLSLGEDNFKAEEVLQLLDSNYIRTRFSISNLELIRKAVDKANIRFGIEGLMDDETIYVSWKNGIRRLMYGICMSGEEEYAVDGYTTYPLDIAEGEDSFELIRFCHFAEVLISTIEDRKQVRTITEWGEYIEQVVDKLIYQTEDNNDEDYRLLLKNLEKLYVLNDVVTDKVTFDVFKHSFVQSLTGETRSNAFASGGITFCSLIPMRSIPFKVVALLGLNFDKFPRKETRVSFNLMEQEKRKGDRNVKENDKHLFLETILSAQQYLYISYPGRNSKDNTAMPPSVLIDELIDYIQTGVDDDTFKVREAMVTTHPLHGFSHKYRLKNKRLYNYLGQADIIPGAATTSNSNAADLVSFEEVSIDSFINFFKNPFKAYYNDVLLIRYEQDNVLLPENEVFEVDGLQSWQMKQDLLFSEADELDTYRNKGVANGTLPLKHMADWALASAADAVTPLKKLVGDCIGDAAEESMQVELSIDSILLKGKLSRLYDGKLIFISFSKNETKYLLEAYIKYLIAIAAGNPVDLYYISFDRTKVYKISESRRSRKSALKSLQKLMNLYRLGHEEILMFYPDFNKSPGDVIALSYDKFRVMLNKYIESEFCDDYIKKEYSFGFFNQNEVFEQYIENSHEIFGEAKDLFEAYYTKS
ncbi:MAG: exodeoxyribonuclease V subunit gamma [Bacteroidota bacterium]|nr:exodeoxyribonuclease V subunit gamma [Bacteroidota bacterium]